MLDAQLSAVYEEHADYVWANLRRLGVPSPELDDAVQETFLVAFRRLDSVRQGAPWRPWLFGIARRVASHHRRSRGRRQRLSEAVAREPRPIRDPHDAVALRHAAELAHRFLQTLSPRRREVFILAEIEGHTGAEIAELLGIPHNTVWSRLRGARESFRRYLAVLDARERGTALLAAARRERMPPGRKQNAMALLGIRLAAEPGIMATFLGALKPVAISVTLGTAALTTVAVAAHAGPAPPPPPSSANVRAGPPAAAEPTSPPAPPVVVTVPPELAADRPAPPAAAHVPPSRSHPPRSRTRPAALHRPVTANAAALREELLLLEELRAATKSGAFEDTLTLAARHRRRFAHGELAVERDVQEIAALCGLQRFAAARTKIAGLGTPLPRAVADACEEKATTSTAAGQQE